MMLQLRDGVSAADTEYGMALLDEDSGQYWNLKPTASLALRTPAGGRDRGAGGAGVDRRVCGGCRHRQPGHRGSGRRAARGRPGEGAVDVMSMPEAVFYQPRAVPLPRRIVIYLVVGAARLFARRSPPRSQS